MKQTSRGQGFKTQKVLTDYSQMSIDEQLATKKSVATANHEKFDKDTELIKVTERDAELERVTKIPVESSDLIVVTALKKLASYTILVTQKSPKQFRGVFVNRMQNYCLDAIENTFTANGINIRSEQEFEQRKAYQNNAIQKLKLLSYMGLLAENVGCILPKQYKQISFLIADSINLISSWKKSDSDRWRDKRT